MRARHAGAEREVTVRTSITRESLDEPGFLAPLGTSADGAVLIFQGRVRDTHEGRAVTRLSYEAYEGMAERELEAICREAGRRFEVGEIAAAHRVGRLELEEVSIAIGVAAPHRAACYEASRWIIEEVKARLPVWKHEHYADGTSQWVGAPEGLTAASPEGPGADDPEPGPGEGGS